MSPSFSLPPKSQCHLHNLPKNLWALFPFYPTDLLICLQQNCLLSSSSSVSFFPFTVFSVTTEILQRHCFVTLKPISLEMRHFSCSLLPLPNCYPLLSLKILSVFEVHTIRLYKLYSSWLLSRDFQSPLLTPTLQHLTQSLYYYSSYISLGSQHSHRWYF